MCDKETQEPRITPKRNAFGDWIDNSVMTESGNMGIQSEGRMVCESK